jgi:hypothetical protein
VTDVAPANRAAITVRQPIAATRHEHGLAEQVTGAVHAVQTDRQRLGKRNFAQAHVARDRVALALSHHEVFAEHALHVRIQTGAAEEAHVSAQMLAALATIIAVPARMRRAHRDPVSDLDPGNAGADPRDDTRGFMAWNEGLAHNEAPVAALEIIVQVGAADATGAESNQYLPRRNRRFVGGFNAQVFLGVNATGHHGLPLLLHRVPAGAETLVSLVQMALHCSACACLVVRGDGLLHRTVLGHCRIPEVRGVIVMLELLI